MKTLTKGLSSMITSIHITGREVVSTTNLGKNVNQGSNPHKHQRTQLPQNHYKCRKVFDQNSNLITHPDIYIVENSDKCSEYDKFLTQSLNFTEHQNIQPREEPYKCN